jgi:bacterioferritin-associated ferredoxin
MTPSTAETTEREIRVHATIEQRDELHFYLKLRGDEIMASNLRAVGCPALLSLVKALRTNLHGSLKNVALPEGNSHAVLLIREVLLKARGEWKLPYEDVELCHCRAVPTVKVDGAIVTGAHTVLQVSARTSAGTSCGTCKPDIESLIHYRLGRKAP